jgi:ornithine--oxo-acid transaminase
VVPRYGARPEKVSGLKDVWADPYRLGKALGGGVPRVSAVVGSAGVLSVPRPGQHGSTFGGDPLAGVVGRAVVTLLVTGEPQKRALVMGRSCTPVPPRSLPWT